MSDCRSTTSALDGTARVERFLGGAGTAVNLNISRTMSWTNKTIWIETRKTESKLGFGGRTHGDENYRSVEDVAACTVRRLHQRKCYEEHCWTRNSDR